MDLLGMPKHKYMSVNIMNEFRKVLIYYDSIFLVLGHRQHRSRNAHTLSRRPRVERAAPGNVVASALSTPGCHAARLYVTRIRHRGVPAQI